MHLTITIGIRVYKTPKMDFHYLTDLLLYEIQYRFLRHFIMETPKPTKT